jgi:hypothetical protein
VREVALTSARAFVERRVEERVRRVTAEQVQDTCSFARAERLIGREYHGRFLIELLQNAADAWREGGTSGERSRVRIEIGVGPSLLVANRGKPFPATAVIESLGQIGRSTKTQGEAIGHKGIGFKSVLEISLAPELYSGLAEDEPGLAIRFDPRDALERIRASSPDWDAHVAEIDDILDPLDAVPVLRYPLWVEQPPVQIRELASEGFDTVIRLPYDDRLGLDPDRWLSIVRDALTDLTDQMLLLLGTFERLEVVDRLNDRVELIEPQWGGETVLRAGATREPVTVLRNGEVTSRWWLYRDALPDGHELAGELAVGLRRSASGALEPAIDGALSAPFHLFFPTKIGSGLPFLLHGYFEVNAARTGFFDGSAASNTAILNALSELVSLAVDDFAASAPDGVTTLADLLASCGRPEDPSAAAFQDRTLRQLDQIAWVPLESAPTVPALAPPTKLLVDDHAEMLDRIHAAFSPDYVLRRTGLAVPSRQIGDGGHRFLAQRRHPEAAAAWAAVALLCRPGPGGPWDRGEEGERFRALLELVTALRGRDRRSAEQLLVGLRGDPDTCLLPVVAADGERTLLPVTDPREGVRGRRSRLVMARVRDSGGAELVPPPTLDVAFVPDGLLSEPEVDSAKPLGVREFTVDNILGRLPETAPPGPELLTFLWSLLRRERRSEFWTGGAAQRAVEFEPAEWFWCRPGHGSGSEADADRQRRRRLLAATALPARDGTWRPAGTLAFGHEWADWLDAGACGPTSPALQARAGAYRALDAVAPGPSRMLGDPATVLAHLPEPGVAAEQHAFLLMLGVWEVLPIEAFASWETRDRPRFPWSGEFADTRAQHVDDAGGWRFVHHPWAGHRHEKVWIAEDFRFAWPLRDAAERDPARTAELLSAGAALYARLGRAAAFCDGCTSASTSHYKRYSSAPDENYPSLVTVELETAAWVPAIRDGEPLERPCVPTSVWWAARPPSGAALRQSPLRYLRLCDPGADLAPELRRHAGIVELERAGPGRVEQLLADLRAEFERAVLPVTLDPSGGAKQAFVSLHRVAYERLRNSLPDDPRAASEALARVGVLCDLGDRLGFLDSPADARHDDGRFAAYRRYFTGHVPFAVLQRDREAVATHLGIPPLNVALQRRAAGVSVDVTEELAEMLGDRVAELLAIVVNHKLGGLPLELGSQAFAERARRLRNLRVMQVDDLVIDARVEGTNAAATIGEGCGHDVFLEDATTSKPVLFHDFKGPDWKEQLRRKLAPHLAALLENSAYAATIALFLLAVTDADREEALHELGITAEDVDQVRANIGVISEDERRRHARWFAAVVGTLTGGEPPTIAPESAAEALVAAGMRREVADRLAELGGGEARREDPLPGGALWFLAENGADLAELDQRLRAADPSDGLRIAVAKSRLRVWTRQHRSRVAAVLSRRRPPEDAKSAAESWRAPRELRFALDPGPELWLAPVVASLRVAGLQPSAEALAADAVAELVRLAGVNGERELDALIAHLYDPEERRRILQTSASSWRRELRLLAVLARTGQGDSRAAIRAQADTVDALLPAMPSAPSEFVPALALLLPDHERLAGALEARLTETLSAAPERVAMLELAAAYGLGASHLAAVERALEAPTRELAKRLRGQMAQLEQASLRPVAPAGITAVESKPRRRIGAVKTIKVDARADARKRQLGDEGERWAMAAVLAQLVPLPAGHRQHGIDEVVQLLRRFDGAAVELALSHAEPAREPEIDEEELIDELRGLLYVARYSDGFGFDMLGYLSPAPAADPIALCLEVKSTRDGRFHLSRAEWETALEFHAAGEGDRYALLVVHRAAANGPPARLDLLANPIDLVADGQLAKRDDGYEIAYHT